MRRWIANPARLLPYTGMPVNIKFGIPLPPSEWKDKDLATRRTASLDQMDAVVELLLNYDHFVAAKFNEDIKLNGPLKIKEAGAAKKK